MLYQSLHQVSDTKIITVTYPTFLYLEIYETVYEYAKHEIRCLLNQVGGPIVFVNDKGQVHQQPAVTKFFPNQLHI